MKNFIFYIFAIYFFVSCSSQDAKEISNTKKIDKSSLSKYYQLKTINNNKIDLNIQNNIILSKDLNGKLLLINFWASWCKPCIEELPVFINLQQKYRDKFSIISILYKDNISDNKLKKLINKYKINFPIIRNEDNNYLSKDSDNVNMVPESFIYSKDGFFIKKIIGKIDKNILEKYIKDNMK